MIKEKPCKDWHDVPSDEMTLEQARQAVKDLRKKLAEYLWQTPCDDAISRQAVIRWVKTECNPYGKPTLDFESGKKVIEHLKRMSPITPQPKTEVLDKIRTEVEALPKTYPFVNHIDMYVKEDDVKKIIDKYKRSEE